MGVGRAIPLSSPGKMQCGWHGSSCCSHRASHSPSSTAGTAMGVGVGVQQVAAARWRQRGSQVVDGHR